MVDRFITAAALKAAFALEKIPDAAIITGSNQGEVLRFLEDTQTVPYSEICGFASSTVIGHASRLTLGKVGEKTVLALEGRRHFYEGCTFSEIVFPIRVLAALGIKNVIMLNAAGGINLTFAAGDIMIINDHINLSGRSPLVGPNDEEIGVRFPDMSEPYSKKLIAKMHAAGAACGIPLREGVYCYTVGPNYETPAEIRYMRTIGGDAVGMSTVPEAIAARHAGMNVLAMSGITNSAAGIAGKFSHEEVMEGSAKQAGKFRAVLGQFLK